MIEVVFFTTEYTEYHGVFYSPSAAGNERTLWNFVYSVVNSHSQCKDNTSPTRNVLECPQMSANVLKCPDKVEKMYVFLVCEVKNPYL